MTADVVDLTRQVAALTKRVEVLERGVTDDASESLEAPGERIVFRVTLTTGEVREVTATPDACVDCEACGGDPLKRGWTARADGEDPSYSIGDPRVAVLALCVGASCPVVAIYGPDDATITEREAAAFKRGAEMVRGIFAQGGMRVVGSTDDLIRAFGEAAR